MDPSGFFVIVLGVLIAVPIWLVITVLGIRREAEESRRENITHWQDLTARLYVLETELKKLKEAAVNPREPAHETPASPEPVPTATKPPIDAPADSATVKQPTEPAFTKPEPTPVPRPLAPVVPSEPAQAGPSATHAQPLVTPHTPATPLPRPPLRATSPPLSAPVFSQVETPRPAARAFDLEEMLGTNWLNKIGIGILVLGLAFFLAYQLQNLGPAGKVLLGVALSAAMIAIGIRYESNARYRLLARASAAGGWALLYFVSYAVYHVPAAHVIDSPQLDFFLMIAVATAIVAYSLRYQSEATTALALVLSYLTVGIHHTSVYSLFASVILAITVVTLALRMKWFALELFGILATYFNHLLWVSPVVEAFNPRHLDFPEFRASVALLVFYWFLFRFSYIYRDISNEAQERLSAAAALVNGFCLLALLRYQSVHPEWAFYALLALGATELVMSVLAARRRRAAFIVLATLGSILIIAAIPFRYSGSNLSILWLVAAEAFLLAGVFLHEVVFRRIGLIAIIVVAGQMILDTGASLLELRLSNVANVPPDYPTAVLFLTAAALCYFNSHWVRIRWSDLFEHEFDSSVARGISYIGGLLILISAWFATPSLWTAVGWAALALVLDLAGQRLAQAHLAVQGNLIAVACLIRLVTLNLWTPEEWDGFSLRLITVGITAILLYAAAPFARAADEAGERTWSWLTAAYTWAASILVGMLIWDELPSQNVAIGWMVLGLVLLEIGLRLKAGFLRWQGYAALGASFLGMLALNLDVAKPPGEVSSRLTRVVPLALAYFYADWRLRTSEQREEDIASAFSYLGVISLAALLYFELAASWVATGWAVLALVLIAAAWIVNRCDYLRQSYVMAAAVAVRVIIYNFFQPAIRDVLFGGQRYYVGIAIVFLFAALPFAFAIRRSVTRQADQSSHATRSRIEFSSDTRPEQVFFFVPFGLLTALIAIESSRGQLTVSWGIEGVLVFLFAVWVGERSFRLAGLGLLLACVVKIFVIDVWGLDPQSRYITLIVLGGALVLVSFLYTRHKEKFQRYL